MAFACLAVVCGGSAAFAAAAPETLTVADCVARTRARAPSVAAAAFDERAAALDSSATALNRRPDVALSTGAWIAPDGSYDPAFTNLGEYHAQLGMNWTLLDGGRRRRARERAGLDAAGARARRGVAVREAGENAASLALRTLRLRETLAILAESREGLRRIGSLVRSAVSSGAHSPADSIRLGLAEEDADLELEAAGAEASATQLDLLETMGRDLDDAVVIRPPRQEATGVPGAADSLALAASATRRPELDAARAEEAAARLEVLETSRRSAPELSLAVDAGLAGTDLTRAVPGAYLETHPGATFGDRLRRDLGASAAFTLRFPVLDAARRPASDARTAGLRAAEQRRVAEELRQRREARALFLAWRSAAERLRLAESVVERAESHFLRTKSLYAAGATTLFDLLDAQQLSRDARLRCAEAREELRVVRFRIVDRR